MVHRRRRVMDQDVMDHHRLDRHRLVEHRNDRRRRRHRRPVHHDLVDKMIAPKRLNKGVVSTMESNELSRFVFFLLYLFTYVQVRNQNHVE